MLAATAGSAAAQGRAVAIVLPAATLDRTLVALSGATGTDIASTEAGLRSVRTRPLRGSMTVAQALDRLLAGTGYRAVPGGGGAYRVVAIPRRKAPPPPRRRVAPEPLPADIVVTASKQRVSLLRYPGSLTRVAGSPLQANGATGDISALAQQLPILQTTQLGVGRNKVFIRGIADSSFNGTTQSTASVYLDDVQLNASGPDPGLRLYDMQSVEVMEGPQGTLYGAGAIGGVLRLTSHAPELDRVAASIGAGATVTQGGSPGGDLAGMVNLPVIAGRVALRTVAYVSRDGGYIDDPRRGGNDVNRTNTVGARIALRVDPGSGWRIDTSGVAQQIRARDGQYAERPDGALRRTTATAQPFADRFLFGRLVIAKDWDSGLRLVSATGVADYGTFETFDATPGTAVNRRPLSYRVDTDKLLVSQELRLSRSLAGGNSWLAGFSLVSDRSILSRALGLAGNETDIVGVSNVTRAASGFGEATVALSPAVSITAGGRYTSARVDGEPSSTRRPGAYIKGRSTQRFDPTIAGSVQIAPGIAAFARYQTGFRTGGLAVAQGIGRVANFDADSIDFAEIGVRRLRARARGLGLSVSASTANWTGIQADLLNRRGQPFTTNLGDARVRTVEATLDWMPTPRLTVAGVALYAFTRVSGPIADQSRENNRRLPETPPFAGSATLAYAFDRHGAVTPRVGAALSYIGRSVLGTGDLLDVSQGDYLTASVSGGLRWRDLDLTIGIDNLTDVAANRFAFGNPFGLAARDQITPLRPRNLRVGVSAAW
ncbi:TonB-dependent receptor [Sphingomonas sp. A2-49]|uniref:TonB-dependent receptor domain-containing protein n=1 Tax=Sphingomonas sp. A2-49 TaxID=1391375 RepID=UPI0021D3A1BF|nr:TonB-dependent receptor [Sphingomonas sp. A2-49]MCU6454577.1 TonB-dependent receptor [Sphingomonas sp. A2-49]